MTPRHITVPETLLREALADLLHAVCGETGFANAVRKVSGLAYPWPALDMAEEKARRALAGQEAERTTALKMLVDNDWLREAISDAPASDFSTGQDAERTIAVPKTLLREIVESAVRAVHPAYFQTDYNHGQCQGSVRKAASAVMLEVLAAGQEVEPVGRVISEELLYDVRRLIARSAGNGASAMLKVLGSLPLTPRSSCNYPDCVCNSAEIEECAHDEVEQIAAAAKRIEVQEAEPAILYQQAEERLCDCGTAGSGEGHSEGCAWLESEWPKWGDAVNAVSAIARLDKFLNELPYQNSMMTVAQVRGIIAGEEWQEAEHPITAPETLLEQTWEHYSESEPALRRGTLDARVSHYTSFKAGFLAALAAAPRPTTEPATHIVDEYGNTGWQIP